MARRWRICDLGVFTLRVPADWTAEEHRPATLVLRAHPDELTVTLTACGRPENGASDTAAQRELARWLRAQPNLELAANPRPAPSVGNFLAAAEAVTHHNPVYAWLSRLFSRDGPLHWRFWVALNPHMTLRASCVGPAVALHEQQETLEQIIHSIRLPERDLLVGRPFAETVAALARTSFPHTPVALLDDAHVRFGTCPLDVAPLFRRYLKVPEDLPQHVREFFGEVRRAQGGAVIRPWPELRSQVLPHLVPGHSLATLGPHCAHQDWVNDLAIVYLPDEEPDPHAVNQDELDAWAMDVDDLHRQALANLAARSSELVMEGSRVEGCTMLALSGRDACNAARLLLPDLHGKLRPYLGQTFYAAIPGRELLLVFCAQRPGILARMRRQIEADYHRASHPISNRLFLATADGIAGDPDYADSFTL